MTAGYIPRALRQKWADDAHEARHPERAVERLRSRDANKKALADTFAAYPTITPDNFDAANDYRERRIKFHLGA